MKNFKLNSGVSRWVLVACMVVFGLVGVGRGQDADATTAEGVLVSMASKAGVIFVGQVVSITRADDQGYVDVSFRVDQALRGCNNSGAYTVREWVGLWMGQAERYRVGQRSLMLLTAKSAAGFSAPVNGMDGVIPVVANVPSPVMRSAGVVPADAAVEGDAAPEASADLRWIRARVVRGVAGAAGGASLSNGSAGSGAAGKGDAGTGYKAEWVGVTGTGFQPISDWVGPIAPMPMSVLASHGRKSSEPTLSSVVAVLSGLN